MSDIMRPMPFAHLMNWILSEYRAQGSVFGVSKLVRHADGKSLPIFEEKIESPYGPAAGPHTQLAQNIIAAWLCGARMGGPSVYFGTLTPKPWLGPDQAEAVPWDHARLLALCELLRYSALCGGLTLWLCATAAKIPVF